MQTARVAAEMKATRLHQGGELQQVEITCKDTRWLEIQLSKQRGHFGLFPVISGTGEDDLLVGEAAMNLPQKLGE